MKISKTRFPFYPRCPYETLAYNLVTDMPPIYEERENFQLLL
jgi:hypothetical protein